METVNQDSEKVLSKLKNKLRKLKAFYENAKTINSEGEAAAAAAAIQRIISQYNLSLEEIHDVQNLLIQEKVSGYTYKSIGGKWEYRLLYAISKYNFCHSYIYGKSYKDLILIGKRENVENVKWLKSMLAERFVEFSKQRFKDYKESMEYKIKPISIDKYQRNYLFGCAFGLDEKLREENNRDKVKDSIFSDKITALVVRNDENIKQYVKDNFGKIGHVSSKYSFNSAHNYGYRDGKNIELYKPISTKDEKRAKKVNLIG